MNGSRARFLAPAYLQPVSASSTGSQTQTHLHEAFVQKLCLGSLLRLRRRSESFEDLPGWLGRQCYGILSLSASSNAPLVPTSANLTFWCSLKLNPNKKRQCGGPPWTRVGAILRDARQEPPPHELDGWGGVNASRYCQTRSGAEPDRARTHCAIE